MDQAQENSVVAPVRWVTAELWRVADDRQERRRPLRVRISRSMMLTETDA